MVIRKILLKKILFSSCLCLLASSLLALSRLSGLISGSMGALSRNRCTNLPIARARVAVALATERDDVTTIVTAEDGLFSFTGLKPGKYSLTAQAHGYLLQAFNQHDQYSSAIVVGAGLNASGLIFRLAKENIIEGAITDEAARLLAAALARGTRLDHPRPALALRGRLPGDRVLGRSRRGGGGAASRP